MAKPNLRLVALGRLSLWVGFFYLLCDLSLADDPYCHILYVFFFLQKWIGHYLREENLSIMFHHLDAIDKTCNIEKEQKAGVILL